MYVIGYHNAVLRFMHSVFIQLPLDIWYRWMSLVIPSKQRFINRTAVPDSVLESQWSAAQTALSTAPFPLDDAGGGIHPKDPRALTVTPENVTVTSVPDVPIADLVKINAAWGKDKDPSGTILVPSGTQTCHAFTKCWRRPRVYAAASEVPVVLSYEFENIILAKLGYNIDQR